MIRVPLEATRVESECGGRRKTKTEKVRLLFVCFDKEKWKMTLQWFTAFGDPFSWLFLLLFVIFALSTNLFGQDERNHGQGFP